MEEKTNDNDFTDYDLKLKAVGVSQSVFVASDYLTKYLQDDKNEFNHLGKKAFLKGEDTNKIFFVVHYVLLFMAQKVLYEGNFAGNEEKALVFEKYLFEMFKKQTGVDPKPLFKDIFDYVGNDMSRQIKYLGSKLCRELNKQEGAIEILEISSFFSGFLTHGGFYKSIKIAWELPNEKLEKMLKRIESNDNIKN